MLLLAALGLTSCGVYGPKGNDTGGIIPWSVETEAAALTIANGNCGQFGKYARITSIRRVYGDYIVYECRRPIYERQIDVVTVRG
jgi:hypothetical protein